MRDWIFAALLALAALLVIAGMATWSVGAALISAGLLLAAWAYLVFVVGEAGAAGPNTLAIAAGDEVDAIEEAVTEA